MPSSKKEQKAAEKEVREKILLELEKIKAENTKRERDFLRETYDPNYPVYY